MGFEVIEVVIRNQKGIAQIFFVVLLLAGILVGVFLVQNYTAFLPKADLSNSVSLSLKPDLVTYNKGCEVYFDINLNNTGIQSNGTDAVLLYDPAVISIDSVENGTLYPTYPGNRIDNTNGKAIITGLSSIFAPVSTSGRLATIKVKINPDTTVENTTIRFDFDPNNLGKTNDSNVVENLTVVDRLQEVYDAKINIGSGSGCMGTPGESPSPSSSVEPSPAVSPSPIITPTPSFTPVPSVPSAAKLEGSIETQSRKKFARVRWSGVVNPTKYDKVELIYSPSFERNKKILVNWVYTTSCTTGVPDGATPKSEGTCLFNIQNLSGTFQFRYYSNSLDSDNFTSSSR